MRLKGIITLIHAAMLATIWPGVSVAAGSVDYEASSHNDTVEAPFFDTIRIKTTDTIYFELKFRFDNYCLDMGYMDNKIRMERFDSVLDSIGMENVLKFEIISLSSPEGTYEYNKRLSERRSATMNRFMQDNYPHLIDIMETSPAGESWQMLRDYVAKDTCLSTQSIEKVLQLIDADIDIAAKKWRMKTSLGKDSKLGDIYAYLYETYYPRIRFSGITIEHHIEIVNIIERPQMEIVPTITIPYHPDTIVDFYLTDTVVEPCKVDTFIEPYKPDTVVSPTFRRFPKLALKTNMLYNATFTPKLGYAPILNVELEYYLAEDGRWSLLGEYEFPWWSKESEHQYLQILNLQLEARYYLKKHSQFTRHYLSAYSGANLFDLCFDDKEGSGVQGEGVHAGLGYGYVLPLNKKGNWKLELFLKGGFYIAYYDKYDAGEPFTGKYYYHWFGNISDFKPRSWRFRWLGPTGAGVTISYDLFYRKKQNK